jgi:hypothetical protein
MWEKHIILCDRLRMADRASHFYKLLYRSYFCLSYGWKSQLSVFIRQPTRLKPLILTGPAVCSRGQGV